MNIYLLIEDGERHYIQAPTMADAVKIREESYLAAKNAGHSVKERKHYHEKILTTCILGGSVKVEENGWGINK